MSIQLTPVRQSVNDMACAMTLDNADSIMAARDAIAALGELLRDAKRVYEHRLVDLLDDAPEKGVNIGTLRFYLGRERKTKCRDQAATLEAVLTAAAGDMGRVAECMAANAWKPGALKEVLGDKWGECFEVIEETEVKEGKPHKDGLTLQVLDTKYLR